MLRTMEGSPDGVTSRQYVEGEVYELPPRLFEILTGAGFAVAVVDTPPEPIDEKPAAKRTRKTAGPRQNKRG